MNLQQKVEQDIKNAMLEKRKEDLLALRAIKSAILLAKTEKGKVEELDSDQELKILTKMVKQRKDSADIFNKEKRTDLAEKEEYEAAIISQYLPKQLSIEEVTEVIKGIVQSTGASSMKDMGKVMGIASQQLAGKTEGKIIADVVKALLNQ